MRRITRNAETLTYDNVEIAAKTARRVPSSPVSRRRTSLESRRTYLSIVEEFHFYRSINFAMEGVGSTTRVRISRVCTARNDVTK